MSFLWLREYFMIADITGFFFFVFFSFFKERAGLEMGKVRWGSWVFLWRGQSEASVRASQVMM